MKKWIWIGLILIVFGWILGAVGLTLPDFDIYKLEGQTMVESSYEITEEFSSIFIDTNVDVRLEVAQSGQVRVECFEEDNQRHGVTVEAGTLYIQRIDVRKWYQHIQLFSFREPQITVYLPKEASPALTVKNRVGDISLAQGITLESLCVKATTADISCYADVKNLCSIEMTTGDIRLKDITLGQLSLQQTTGDIELEKIQCAGEITLSQDTGDSELTAVTCDSLVSEGTTGDLEMEQVVAAATLRLERSTGDISMDRCDGGELFITVSTGDVTGTLLSEKIFMAKTGTGSVRVPNTMSGGKCEITTTTGDIRITLAG